MNPDWSGIESLLTDACKPSAWLITNLKAAMNKRNQVNVMQRKSKLSYKKERLRDSSNDRDKFWITFKIFIPRKSKNDTRYQSFDIDGKKSTNEAEIANGFSSSFRLIFNIVWTDIHKRNV